ncbi:MAG: serine acetyltransferase [Chloroflexota bacterium]
MNNKSFFTLFKMDAARWLVPEKIGNPAEVTPLRLAKLLLHHMPLRAMAWFRLAQWCHRRRLPFLPGSIQRRLLLRYGLEMAPSDEIGGGLYIAHPVGCVIRPGKMGENCSIIAAVTIGMRNEWKFPTFGDRVFIGAGARVLGNITLGKDSAVGANAVVVKDVPAGVTVVGIPARPLPTKAPEANPPSPQITAVPHHPQPIHNKNGARSEVKV